MHFLVPFFWISSIALAIPVLLHLTRREVKRPTLFPSLMFLQNTRVRELRRRRIRQLPLLFIRCLVLLLLIAAFAQPVLNRGWLGAIPSDQGRSILLLVDNSLSVSREEVWSQVEEAVLEEIDGLTDNDEASIVQFGESAEILWNWDRRREPLKTAVREYLKPSFSGTSYDVAFRRASELLEEASNPNKELCLISDLQATGFGDQERKALPIPFGTKFKVKEVGQKDSNSYLDQVRLIREVFEEDYPYSVQAQLVSIPPAEGRSEVSIYLEDNLLDRRTCDWDTEGRAMVRFSPFSLPFGISRGRIVLDSKDGIAADDIFHFVLEKREPFVVTLLRNENELQPYFEQALSSGRNLPFRVNAVSGLSELSVQKSPVLVLDNVPVPPAADLMRSYLEEGGGVIVCPGNEVSADDYNREFQQLLPVVFKNREFARGQNLPFFRIDQANWDHPVFAGAGEGLADVRFYGHWALEILQGAEVLVWFDTGAPALVETSVGSGKILLFASSLGRVWSDFPVSNSYVPFWQMMVQYAGGWRRQPSAVKVNDVIARKNALPEDESAEPVAWEVLDPAGQRLFSLDGMSPKNVQVEIPGYYEIRRDKRTDWVAVNTDRMESDLSRLDSGEILAVLKAAQAGTATVQETSESEQSLWGLLLLAAVLLLIAESVLANGYSGDSRSAKRALG